MVDEAFLARIKRKPDLARPVALALGHRVVAVTTWRGCRGRLRSLARKRSPGIERVVGPCR
jgi:hypothetical protein